ncbi:RHS repeat domain-containing protein [Pararcticibacter amylolyticus]|nr:DUF6443 domain-containing protein [Pararcticibacter amylolyticus]
MKTLKYISKLLLCFILILITQKSFSQGASSSDPIIVDLCGYGGWYSDVQDTRLGTFQNDGQIWYRFAIGSTQTVTISHCSSEIDTYMELYSYPYGNISLLTSNDDNGPECHSSQASIRMTLDPGIYYVMSGGHGDVRGDIITEITCAAPSGSSLVGATYNNPIDMGTIMGVPRFDTRSILSCYSNLVGQSGKDICYKFNVSSNMNVSVSTEMSNVALVNLYILDANKNIIETADGIMRNIISNMSLTPGSYYAIVEPADYQYTDYEHIIRVDFKADIPGAQFIYPINAGVLTNGSTYSDLKNNSPSFGYANDMGQPSDDIFYKFKLNTTTNTEVTISHCGSNFDTYLYLLDAAGNIISSNDNNGPVCNTTQASIKQLLSPGTYYVVSEGAGNNSGNLNTQISVGEKKGWTSNVQNYVRTYIPRTEITDYTAVESASSNKDLVQTSTAFFDGLGQLIQTVQRQGSASGSDLVQAVMYDGEGREFRKYLPYKYNSTDGGFKIGNPDANVKAFYNPLSPGATGISPSDYPYADAVIEQSSIGRMLEQGAPGAAWQPVSSAVSGGGHTIKTTYGGNSYGGVKKWSVTATGGAVNGTYSNTTLSKTTKTDENGNRSIEYKDIEGMIILKQAEGPQGAFLDTYYVYDDLGNLRYVIPPAVTVTSFNEIDDVYKQYIYGYVYDNKNRLAKKHVPGKGIDYFVYNKLDQVILTQNSMQRDRSYTLWSFTKYDAHGRVVLTGECDFVTSQEAGQANADLFTGAVWETFTGTGPAQGYNNASYPTNYTKILTVNYYGEYSVPGNSSTYNASVTVSPRIKGLLTASKENIIGTSDYLLSVNYYDDYGRLKETVSQNHLGGVDRIVKTYSFNGELKTNTRVHNTSTASVTISNRYIYDHMGRERQVFQKMNNDPEVKLTDITYNEVGQSINKTLCNDQQSTSYAYNQRGWLKSSVSPQFAFELKYENGTSPQYNGNVSNQLWGNGVLNNTFTYTYDKLNRMLSGTSPGLGETVNYDVMGNITSLTRDGYGTNTYSYNGNRLNSILGFLNGSYSYDTDGSMTQDGPRGISISYNSLGLPQKITGNQNVTYTYTARGVKLKKQSASGVVDYVNGIQYLNGSLDIVLTEEGVARRNGSSYSYEYDLKDHLGNVRYTFYRNPSSGQIERIQSDNYYPFGLRKSVAPVSLNNKYLYNGKELQEELNQYDYGARFYDPVVGRFNTIDPLLELDRKTTPYAYVFNNPLRFIDPTGMKGESTHTDIFGNVLAVYHDGDLGVYKHDDNADGSTPTKANIDKRHAKSTSAGGEKMGETEFWDEFIAPGETEGSGSIHFSKDPAQSWDGLVKWGNERATNQDLSITQKESKLNQVLDIKNNKAWADAGPMTGRLLNGKFATARSAGNYLAGMNGVTGTFQGNHISGETYMKLAGAYQVGEFTKWNIFRILTFGTAFGPAPYYGEETYSGRRILQGINAGLSNK